jgi:hypothetical protein
MTEQVFSFLANLSAAQRQEHFDGKMRVYELTFPFSDAAGTVHSQEFQLIRATNAAEARRTGRMIATHFGFADRGWNFAVRAVRICK